MVVQKVYELEKPLVTRKHYLVVIVGAGYEVVVVFYVDVGGQVHFAVYLVYLLLDEALELLVVSLDADVYYFHADGGHFACKQLFSII